MRCKPCLLRVTISLVVLSFFLFGSVVPLAAQEQLEMRAVSLSVANIDGTAQIFSRVEREKQKDQSRVLGTSVPENWQPLRPGASIQEGAQLRTGPDSTLELKLNDGTSLHLSGDSLVVVEKLRSRRADVPQTTELFLERGTIKTQQTTQILGQTSQIIKTQNGAVNTQLGEVEVYRPFLPEQGRGRHDKTMVNILRGTTEINSLGEGQMDVKSLLQPETCHSQDGIRFILKQQQDKVRVSRLVDQNGFRATAQEPFQLLVATEGTANEVVIMTHDSKGVVDLDGLYVAALEPNASVKMTMHDLLTAGVETQDVTVKLACNEDESREISDFGIQALSGGVTIARMGLPEAGNAPSRGVSISTSPGSPTPTPGLPGGLPDTIWFQTPPQIPGEAAGEEEGEEEEGGTPEEECGIPITHTFSPLNPVFDGALSVTPQLNTENCLGANQYQITVSFDVDNYLPTLQGGMLYSIETDSSWNPQATFSYPLDVPNSTKPPLWFSYYNYTWPTEEWTVNYYFCYIPPAALNNMVYFQVWMHDACKNSSSMKKCSGSVTGQFTCP